MIRLNEESATEQPKCQKCGDTGMADSGGTQPWGEQILIECDCATAQPVSEQNEKIADALESLLWPNMASGNKEIINAAIQALRAKSEQPVSDGWVKCSERMPENSNDVTVLSEQYGVVNGYYWDGDVEPRWFVCCGEHEGSVYDITHWRPMPAAPGGQDD